MKRLLLAAALLALVGCDRGARKDLPQDNQNLVEDQVDIYLFPDQYPNVAHRCVPEATTGIWTVTADWVWIVYNDPRCGGEGEITVLDNVPGGEPAVSGG